MPPALQHASQPSPLPSRLSQVGKRGGISRASCPLAPRPPPPVLPQVADGGAEATDTEVELSAGDLTNMSDAAGNNGDNNAAVLVEERLPRDKVIFPSTPQRPCRPRPFLLPDLPTRPDPNKPAS